MSVSTEVQRTLVKSPPELWSELSNPEALARHLSELGEIRITAVEPETKVEWESEGASGIVHLKQSGWGTKVTLSVTRTPAIPEQPPVAEPGIVAEPGPAPIAAVEPEPVATEPVVTESEPIEPEPIAVEPEPSANCRRARARAASRARAPAWILCATLSQTQGEEGGGP